MRMFKNIKLVILAKFHSGRTLNAGLLLEAFFLHCRIRTPIHLNENKYFESVSVKFSSERKMKNNMLKLHNYLCPTYFSKTVSQCYNHHTHCHCWIQGSSRGISRSRHRGTQHSAHQHQGAEELCQHGVPELPTT